VVPPMVLLRNNRLSDESAKVLARTFVAHLDVGLNIIGEEGAHALAAASCGENAKFRVLRIDSNFVDYASFSFADALATKQCGLEHLDLADNILTTREWLLLQWLLEETPSCESCPWLTTTFAAQAFALWTYGRSTEEKQDVNCSQFK
jgi:hypothetical protein